MIRSAHAKRTLHFYRIALALCAGAVGPIDMQLMMHSIVHRPKSPRTGQGSTPFVNRLAAKFPVHATARDISRMLDLNVSIPFFRRLNIKLYLDQSMSILCTEIVLQNKVAALVLMADARNGISHRAGAELDDYILFFR